MYNKFSEEEFLSVGGSSVESYSHAFDIYESLHKEVFAKLKLEDLQYTIDNCGKNYLTIKTIRNLVVNILVFQCWHIKRWILHTLN